MGLTSEGIQPRGITLPNDLIEVGGSAYIWNFRLTVKHFPDVFEVGSGVQSVLEFRAQLFGMFSDTPIEVCEVRVKVVIDFKFGGRFVEEHPTAATEYFDISVAFPGETQFYFFAQCFFPAHPTHEAVHV